MLNIISFQSILGDNMLKNVKKESGYGTGGAWSDDDGK